MRREWALNDTTLGALWHGLHAPALRSWVCRSAASPTGPSVGKFLPVVSSSGVCSRRSGRGPKFLATLLRAPAGWRWRGHLLAGVDLACWRHFPEDRAREGHGRVHARSSDRPGSGERRRGDDRAGVGLAHGFLPCGGPRTSVRGRRTANQGAGSGSRRGARGRRETANGIAVSSQCSRSPRCGG